MTYDQIVGAIKDIGLPTTLLLLFLYGAWRFAKGPGNEIVRALVTYLTTAHEQLLTLPTVIREEAERSRDLITRAHLETRAYVESLLDGRRDDRSAIPPAPPTPKEPAVQRASAGALPVPPPPPPRGASRSRPDLGGERASAPLVPRPPLPSRP